MSLFPLDKYQIKRKWERHQFEKQCDDTLSLSILTVIFGSIRAIYHLVRFVFAFFSFFIIQFISIAQFINDVSINSLILVCTLKTQLTFWHVFFWKFNHFSAKFRYIFVPIQGFRNTYTLSIIVYVCALSITDTQKHNYRHSTHNNCGNVYIYQMKAAIIYAHYDSFNDAK